MEDLQLNRVFSALADPTRRRILEIIRKKDSTVLELSAEFDISLPAISKHLRVLENAMLLERKKSGRFVICCPTDAPLKSVVQWMSQQYDFWNQGFDTLDNLLNHRKEKGGTE